MRNIILIGSSVVALIAACVLMMTVFITTWADTGPNCPGKNPRWIGWCNEAPTHRENNNG